MGRSKKDRMRNTTQKVNYENVYLECFKLMCNVNGSVFSKIKVEPNDIGKNQFYEYQVQGKYKFDKYGMSDLDDYFFVLKEGKHKFDLLVQEQKIMYYNGEFWGFERIIEDWKGKEWMLKYIFKWYNGEYRDVIDRM